MLQQPGADSMIEYKRGDFEKIENVSILRSGFDNGAMDTNTKAELDALLKGYFCGAACRKK